MGSVQVLVVQQSQLRHAERRGVLDGPSHAAAELVHLSPEWRSKLAAKAG